MARAGVDFVWQIYIRYAFRLAPISLNDVGKFFLLSPPNRPLPRQSCTLMSPSTDKLSPSLNQRIGCVELRSGALGIVQVRCLSWLAWSSF